MGLLDDLLNDDDRMRASDIEETDSRLELIKSAKKTIISEVDEIWTEMKNNTDLHERRQFENNVGIMFKSLEKLRLINAIQLTKDLTDEDVQAKIEELKLESEKFDLEKLYEASNKQIDDLRSNGISDTDADGSDDINTNF